jgi:hypothetical protein
VADGHIRAVSIGYHVPDGGFVDIQPGQRAEVAGRTFEAAGRTLRISTEWRVHELSLTPIGADEFALIRSKHNPKHPSNPLKGIFR